MKKKILKMATKQHSLTELSMIKKIMLLVLLLLPLVIVVVSGSLIQNGIKGLFEVAITPSVGGLQAQITVDEPSYFTNTNSWRPDGFSVTKGYAPLPVFFQGWQSLPREEIVDYEWNFGDQSAMGDNANVLHGFNSAHVFETPGIYNVTLTIRNKNGQSASTNMRVEVVARPDSKKYYIDDIIGDDNYSGKCLSVSDVPQADGKICGPWKTAQKAFTKVYTAPYDYGDSVLFKANGKYPIMTVPTSTEAYVQGVLFGSYGTGAKPEIYYASSMDYTSGSARLINAKAGSHDVYFSDLNFKFKNPNASARLTGLIGVADQSRGFLFLRVGAEDLRASLFRFGSPSATAMQNEALVTGVYLIDSSVKLNYYGQDTANDPNFAAGDMLFGYMRNMAWIGNDFDKSWGHISYLTHLNKAVIIGNNFSRPAFSRNALRIDGILVNGKGTNNVYIADNKFMGWRDPINSTASDAGGLIHNGGGTRYNLELVHIGPNKGDFDQSVSYVVFERNIVTNFESIMSIADTDNLIVRNNIFVSPQQQASIPGSILIGNRDWEKRPNKNIYINNNTFLINSLAPNKQNASAIIEIFPYNTARGTTIDVSQHTNINFFNNLIYRPQTGSKTIISFNYKAPANLLSQLHFDGNMYYVPSATTNDIVAYFNWSGSTFVSTTNYTFDQWRSLADANGIGYNLDANSIIQELPQFAQSPSITNNAIGAPTSLIENINQANSYREMLKLNDDPTNLAIDRGQNITNVFYDFSGNKRPDGSFASAGYFDAGAFEIIKAPNIPPIAHAQINPTTGVAPLTVSFNGSNSSDSDGSIVNYSWGFGDGSGSSGATVSHVYQTPGNYTIELVVTDNRGGTGVYSSVINVQEPVVVDPEPPTIPAGTGTGLLASYFTNQNLMGTASTIKIDPKIEFAWQANSPLAGIPQDYFSVRWEGDVEVDNTGLYTFYTRTDDGVRLYVDDQLLISKWYGQVETEWPATVNLTAGKHKIKMEYFEASTNAISKLYYSGPGIAKQIVPTQKLYPASAPSVPPPSSCVESWTCSKYSKCENGISTRTCTDKNNCGTIINRPQLSKNCNGK